MTNNSFHLSGPIDKIILDLVVKASVLEDLSMKDKLDTILFFYRLAKLRDDELLNEYAGFLLDDVLNSLGETTIHEPNENIYKVGYVLCLLADEGFIEVGTDCDIFEYIDNKIGAKIICENDQYLTEKLLYCFSRDRYLVTLLYDDEFANEISFSLLQAVKINLSNDTFSMPKVLSFFKVLIKAKKSNIKLNDEDTIVSQILQYVLLMQRQQNMSEYQSILYKMIDADETWRSSEFGRLVLGQLIEGCHKAYSDSEIDNTKDLINFSSSDFLIGERDIRPFRTKAQEIELIDYVLNEKTCADDLSALSNIGLYLLSLGEHSPTQRALFEERSSNVVMILPEVEAMHYGIGSYIKNFRYGLDGRPTNLILINIAYRFPDVNIVQKGNVYDINIPAQKKISERDTQREIMSVGIILNELLRGLRNIVFQINYTYAYLYFKPIEKRFNYRLVSVVHFMNWQTYLNGNRKRFLEIWNSQNKRTQPQPIDISVLEDSLLEKELYEKSHQVVVLNNDLKKVITEVYNVEPNKLILIRNGIYFDDLGGRKKSALRKKYHMDPDEQIIVYSGRVTSQKGISALIMSFTKVLKRNPKARLYIVGGSRENYAMLCKNIWSRIFFVGHQSYEVLKDFYKIADILVLPSIYDICPYVALEAMMFKLPIIASSAPGFEEMFSPNQDCLLANISTRKNGAVDVDVYHLAKQMKTLLDNPSLRKQVKANAYLTYKENHSLNMMMSKYQSVYEDKIALHQ